MAIITPEQIKTFISALQISVSSPLTHHLLTQFDTEGHILKIGFAQKVPGDKGLKKFERIMPGKWKSLGGGKNWEYGIEALEAFDIVSITNLLLLTRLQDDQIVALVEQDPRYRPYAQALGLLPESKGGAPILSLGQARDLIFQTIAQKGLSLAAIAQHAGLSQVSLSNFKAGGDIRLSNLLKIAKAVGVKLVLN